MPHRRWFTLSLTLALAAVPAGAHADLLVGTDRLTSLVGIPDPWERFAGSPSEVDAIAYSPDGSLAFLASGSAMSTWVQDGASLFAATLLTNGNPNPIIAAAADNRRLWVVSGNGIMEVRVNPFATVHHPLAGAQVIMRLAAHPDGTALFAATSDGRLLSIDTTTFVASQRATIPSLGSHFLAVDPSGRFLLAASKAQPGTGHRLTRVRLVDGVVATMALPAAPAGLVTAGDGQAWFGLEGRTDVGHVTYDVDFGLPLAISSRPIGAAAVDLALSSDERYLYVVHASRTVTQLDLDLGPTVGWARVLSSGSRALAAAVRPETGAWLRTRAFSDAAGGSAASAALSLAFPRVNADGVPDACLLDGGGVVCATGISNGFGVTFAAAPTRWTSEFGAATVADESRWRTVRFPDLDGDGRSDICGRDAAGIRCGISTGAGFAFGTNPIWATVFGGTAGGGVSGNPARWRTIQFLDLNGDHKADLCGLESGGLLCGTSTGSAFTNVGFRAPFLAETLDRRWRTEESWWSTLRFGDIDGDGFPDVCARRNDGVWCARNDRRGGFGAASRMDDDMSDLHGWNAPELFRTIQLADVDGDGRADLCGRGNGGVQCARSVTDARGLRFELSAGPLARATDFSDANGWNAERFFRTIRVVDVTGDGLADVCGRGSGGIMCQYSRSSSRGISFLPPVQRVSDFGDDEFWNVSESYWGTVQPVLLDGSPGAEWCGRGDQGILCSFR